jgi:uncharacterized protein YjiS (DUF1127 family)
MLNIGTRTRASLVGLAKHAAAAVRATRRHRAERAALNRLLGEDDHLLSDIGVTRHQIAMMLGR